MAFNTFSLVGHQGVRRILAASIARPHGAYLFSGPAHVGKSLVAREFACALLGIEDVSALATHADFMTLDVQEEKSLVSVEQVRDLKERVAMRPLRAQRNVVFIPQADRFNEAGMNGLLKVLEEPPADAVFLLIAEDALRLPGTIRSRCVLLPFGIVPKAELITALEARGITARIAEEQANAVRGRPGLALLPPEASSYSAIAQDFLTARSVGDRLAVIESLAKTCESETNSAQAWRVALTVVMNALIQHQYTSGKDLPLALGVLDAWKAVGGAVSPRVALEVACVQTNATALLPTHLPRSLPMVYTLSQDL